jgi:hypothetical protein
VYSFTGQCWRRFGARPTCLPTTCWHYENITPTQYSFDQVDIGHWNLTQASASEDTVWVNANIASAYLGYNPCSGYCPKEWLKLEMSPPILAARSKGNPLPVTTLNGTSSVEFIQSYGVIAAQYEVALTPGPTYAFDGYFAREFLDYSCLGLACPFYADLNATDYSAVVTPVTPTTWGRIKSLYR